MTLLSLRRPSGLVMHGIPIARVLELLLSTDGFFRAAVSWSMLVGSDLKVTPDELHAALRRWFSWEDILRRASAALGWFDFSFRTAVEAQRKMMELALRDSWPAVIEQAEALIARTRAISTPAPVATEHGLLWLITNALEDPWDQPTAELTSTDRDRRFARLAMIAAGMTTVPSHLLPASANVSPAPDPGEKDKKPLSTAVALISGGRLAERDVLIRWFVRAVELYDEILPTVAPNVRSAFQARRGIELRTWIVKAFSVTNFVEQELAEGRGTFPEINLAEPPQEHAGNPVIKVIHALSATREQFVEAIRECRGKAHDQTLAVQPLREHPVLACGNDRYLVLHKDFFAAAADDGVWYTLADAVDNFASLFGTAFERYVQCVLERCAAVRNDAVVRIPEGSRPGNKRCDFAWRIGSDLVLIDAKRTGLNAAHLMGDPSIEKRLDAQLGYACEQFLATRGDMEAGRCPEVFAALGVPESWRPRYYVPLVITHRPIFMFFSSASTLLERIGKLAAWDAVFTALPTFWSISDLELLEAALPGIRVDAMLDAIVRRDPVTTCGMPPYLDAVDYKGFTASPYFDRRRKEILAPYMPSEVRA